MKRTTNNSTEADSGGYQVTSVRRAGNSRLSSQNKRQSLTETAPDLEAAAPAVAATGNSRLSANNSRQVPPSKTIPPSSSTRTSRNLNTNVPSKAEIETTRTAATSAQRNPFDSDDETPEERPAKHPIKQQAAHPLVRQKQEKAPTNPFSDDDDDDGEEERPPQKSFSIPNKPNRFAFYDSNESKVEQYDQPKSFSSTMSASKPSKTPFDDSEEEEDKVSKITSYQKSKTPSNSSSVSAKQSKVTFKIPLNKKGIDKEEEEDDTASKASYTITNNQVAKPKGSNRTSSTVTLKTPFDDSEDEEENIASKISSYQKSKAASNKVENVKLKSMKTPFDDSEEEEANIMYPKSKTDAKSKGPVLAPKSIKTPFDDSDDDDDEEENIASKISSYQKSKTASNSSALSSSNAFTKKNSSNPFADDEYDVEETAPVYGKGPANSLYASSSKKSSSGYDAKTSNYSNSSRVEEKPRFNPTTSTKPKSNPFAGDSDDDRYDVGATSLTAKKNPFMDDDDDEDDDEERRKSSKVVNTMKKSNPFSDSEGSSDEGEMNQFSKTSNSSKAQPNPFGDDSEDEEAPHQRTNALYNRTNDTNSFQETNLGDPEQEAEFVRKNESKNCFSRFVFALCPRLAPLHPAMFIFLSLAVAIPAIGYVAAFTKMGYGNYVYFYLASLFQHQVWIFGISLAGYCLLLYIFDVEYWTSRIGKWTRSIVFIILLFAIGTFLLFESGNTPYGPIALFTVLVPIWMMVLRALFFRKVPARVYVSWLGLPMFFVSIFICGAWILWTFQDDENKWTLYIRLVDNQKIGCVPDFTNYEYCKAVDPITGLVMEETCFYLGQSSTGVPMVIFPPSCRHTCAADVYSSCTSTFIIWVGPLLVTVSLFFLSFFTSFLRPENNVNDVYKFAKLWVILLFALWVAASLAGIAQGILTTLAALTLASLIASMILLINATTKDEREARMNELMTTANDKFSEYLDIGRGLLVIVAAPIIFLFLVLSCFVQLIRVINPLTCFCKPTRREKNKHDEDYHFMCITTQADRQIRAFIKWDRVRVFKWAIYWGIAFISLNVIIAKFTVLFLAFVIEELKQSNLDLAAVTFIMIGIGLFLFLLPPVPGVPIYLSIGIIIPAVGGDILTIVGSVAYATGVCFVLRLVAMAVQMKMGVCMKHSLSVRKLCAINTTVVRAATVLLREKWPTMGKCCALIGLPEWPMATMCGVLDLPLLPILLATIPVVLLIFPTVLTGTFLYMSSIVKSDGDPKYPSATTLAAILAVLTALVQFGSMVIAAYYVGQVMKTRADEVDAIPIDDEVKASEEKDKEINQVYKEATKWSNVPWYMKFILILSLILMMGSCYLVQIFQSYCFADFELTSTIQDDLQGNWMNIVKPLGALSIVLFFLSCLLLTIFSIWASMKTSRLKNMGVSSNIVDVDGIRLENALNSDKETKEKEKTKSSWFNRNKNKEVEIEDGRSKNPPPKTVLPTQVNPFDSDNDSTSNNSDDAKSKTSAIKSKTNPFVDDDDEEEDEELGLATYSMKTSNKANPFDDSDRSDEDEKNTPYPFSKTSSPSKAQQNPFDDSENEEAVFQQTNQIYNHNIPAQQSSGYFHRRKDATTERSNPFDDSDDDDSGREEVQIKMKPNTVDKNPFDSDEEEIPPAISNTKGATEGKKEPKTKTSWFRKKKKKEEEKGDDVTVEDRKEVKKQTSKAPPKVEAKVNSKSTLPATSKPTPSVKRNQNPFGSDDDDDEEEVEKQEPVITSYRPNKNQLRGKSSNPFVQEDDDEEEDEEEIAPKFQARTVPAKSKMQSNPFDDSDDEEPNAYWRDR